MTLVRSSTLTASSDLLKQNQTSNGIDPVSSSMVYVYVLRNNLSQRFYTGFTRDLKKRLASHQNTKPGYQLVYYGGCINTSDAMAREKYLKSGPGKKYLKVLWS